MAPQQTGPGRSRPGARSKASRKSSLGSAASVVAALVALLALGLRVLDSRLPSFYVFDPPHLHDLAKRSIAAHGNNTRGIIDFIVAELGEKYPKYINRNEEWLFNNAGGAMGGMYVLHASPTEYIIIFGTTVGTEGHTGRHLAEDFLHILTGEHRTYALGKFEPSVNRPGDVSYLGRGDAQQYRIPESCFALEYARGWVVSMVFFGLVENLTSTFDLKTLWTTVRVTGREFLKNFLVGKF